MRLGKQILQPRRKRSRSAVLLVILAMAVAALCLRTGPTDLLRQAQAVLSSDPAKAEALLVRAIELSGGELTEAQLLRCRALAALGRRDEALGCFSLIRSPEGCDQQALLDLAAQALAEGQNLLARLALDAANHREPQQADVLRMLIPLEHEAASSDIVLTHCKLLESLAPDEPIGWLTEARLCCIRKEVQPAIRAYRRTLQLDLDERLAQTLRGELAGVFIDSGALGEARSIIDEQLATDAVSPELRIKNAYLLRLEGRATEALKTIEAVVSEAPSAAARMLRGILYLDVDRYSEAAADLEFVVAEQSQNKEAHYKLSQAYTKLGQPERASAHLRESQRLTEAARKAH